MDETNSLSIISNVSIQQVQDTMQKITQFQKVIQSTLHQNHDFGIVPGTDKPTLLKPGAEKILMMMGLRSEFEIVDSTRDFEVGFFQYQVRCKLFKGDILITEGLGACNTREKKYINQDSYTLDNTVLKMAKKRALIDATLLVASLSDIFTQDLEDMDLSGQVPVKKQKTLDISNPKDIILTFGKHKGKKLGELPDDYLDWLIKNANDENMRKAAVEVQKYKEQQNIKQEEAVQNIEFNDLPEINEEELPF